MLQLAPREFQVFECGTDSERCNLCEGLWGGFISVCVYVQEHVLDRCFGPCIWIRSVYFTRVFCYNSQQHPVALLLMSIPLSTLCSEDRSH